MLWHLWRLQRSVRLPGELVTFRDRLSYVVTPLRGRFGNHGGNLIRFLRPQVRSPNPDSIQAPFDRLHTPQSNTRPLSVCAHVLPPRAADNDTERIRPHSLHDTIHPSFAAPGYGVSGSYPAALISSTAPTGSTSRGP